MSVAALLVLLLMHHLVMSLMPMPPAMSLPGPGQASAALMTRLVDAPTAGGALTTPEVASCPSCAMPCPLMEGVTPSRTTLRSVDAHHGSHGHWSLRGLHAIRAVRGVTALGTSGPVWRVPPQRTRRAALQVYRL